MMSHVKRQTVIASLSLSAALLLSACGAGPGSDTAVSVNGTDYSVAEVQTAVQELSTVAAAPSTTSDVIRDLAVLPVLEGLVKGTPYEVTDGQLGQILGSNGVPEPGAATMDAARARQYLQVLNNPATFQDPAMAEAAEKMQQITDADFAAVDVEVNPRYGSWDISTGVTPAIPAWINEG